MKKTLIAVAAMAVTGMASAQSSVQIFGTVDTNVRYARSEGAGTLVLLANSGNASSRLGFRGKEDLGDGMYASFWLESGLNTDDGTGATIGTTNNQPTGIGAAVAGRQGLVFARRSTVELGGRWGEVRLGRDFVPTLYNVPIFDPFGGVGVANNANLTLALGAPFGSTSGPIGSTVTRASNSIQYHLPPSLGGINGFAMYAVGENPSNATNPDDGRHVGVRLGYAKGPIDTAIAFGRTTHLAQGDYKSANWGGWYDFGFVKPMLLIVREKTGLSGAERENRSWQVGFIAPVGPHQFKGSYTRAKIDQPGADPAAAQWAVGYVYNFSKRTAAYASYARVTTKDGGQSNFATLQSRSPVVNGGSSGVDIGIRHSF